MRNQPNLPIAIELRAAVACLDVLRGRSSMVTEFVVTSGELPKRLDIFLVNREPKLSRSALQRLIGQGRVESMVRSSSPVKRSNLATQSPLTFRKRSHSKQRRVDSTRDSPRGRYCCSYISRPAWWFILRRAIGPGRWSMPSSIIFRPPAARYRRSVGKNGLGWSIGWTRIPLA